MFCSYIILVITEPEVFACLTGAKSVAKAINKVASGPQRDHGTKRFSHLSDKGLLMLGCTSHL